MSFADELQKLAVLLENGSISPQEYEAAKLRLFNPPPEAAVQEDVEQIKSLVELQQLDREWEMIRSEYGIQNKYGVVYPPTYLVPFVVMVIGALGVLLIIGNIFEFGMRSIYQILGIVGCLFLCYFSRNSMYLTREYYEREQLYLDRRAALRRKLNT